MTREFIVSSLPTIRADYKLFETYLMLAPLKEDMRRSTGDGVFGLTTCCGDQDPLVDEDDMLLWKDILIDTVMRVNNISMLSQPKNKEHSIEPPHHNFVDAGHFYILDPNRVEEVLDVVRGTCLKVVKDVRHAAADAKHSHYNSPNVGAKGDEEEYDTRQNGDRRQRIFSTNSSQFSGCSSSYSSDEEKQTNNLYENDTYGAVKQEKHVVSLEREFGLELYVDAMDVDCDITEDGREMTMPIPRRMRDPPSLSHVSSHTRR